MFKILDGRELFYQWDTDCKLAIDDASIVEVHFCNRTGDCALACQTYTENGLTIVNVPNALLQQSYKLHIYAYNGAQTRFDKCYEVRARSKPTDYAYTETEVLTWHNINNRVNTTIKEVEAAERARQTDEYVRKTQEISRKNAETKRQSNESARVEAEAAREATYNEKSQLLDELTDEASTILSNATIATDRANEAAQSAFSNGSYANQAATYAEYYGEQAETNSYEASKAADRANAAAEQASQSGDIASNAANNANMAAEQATTAANRANTAVSNINGTFANALKGSARGEAVSLKDISPVAHTIEAKVRSKNLVPFPYNTQSGYNSFGVTYTVNEDRSITAVGTATTFSGFVLTKNQIFEVGKSYILSNKLLISYKNTNGETKYFQGTGARVLKWEKGWVLSQIYYQINPNETVNETYYPFIVEATDTPEYTPYIADISAVKVKKNGKNLIPFPYADGMSKTIKGITFTVNADYSITINGTWNGETATQNIQDYRLMPRDSILPSGTYTLSGGVDGGNTYTYRLFGHIIRANGAQEYVSVNDTKGQTFIINNGDTITLSIRIGSEIGTVNNITFYPQLELSTVATEYEPYIEPIEYEVGADGVVNGVDTIYPTTTLVPDTQGAIIDCNYNRDINKAFAELYNAIISTGGNI